MEGKEENSTLAQYYLCFFSLVLLAIFSGYCWYYTPEIVENVLERVFAIKTNNLIAMMLVPMVLIFVSILIFVIIYFCVGILFSVFLYRGKNTLILYYIILGICTLVTGAVYIYFVEHIGSAKY